MDTNVSDVVETQYHFHWQAVHTHLSLIFRRFGVLRKYTAVHVILYCTHAEKTYILYLYNTH